MPETAAEMMMGVQDTLRASYDVYRFALDLATLTILALRTT